MGRRRIAWRLIERNTLIWRQQQDTLGTTTLLLVLQGKQKCWRGWCCCGRRQTAADVSPAKHATPRYLHWEGAEGQGWRNRWTDRWIDRSSPSWQASNAWMLGKFSYQLPQACISPSISHFWLLPEYCHAQLFHIPIEPGAYNQHSRTNFSAAFTLGQGEMLPKGAVHS